ncbi:MAG: FHA domain-containing protein [Leptolyngbyaceae cyanobacterium CRU_2_3]|nr:FHA domain-containing protein [Leptolyngbyaceae cyanobacterium CRU_2_3]
MIVCPNCNHQNPDAAVQCEACYTPLPAMTSCPSCGAAIQADASLLVQCGFNLQGASGSGLAADPLPSTVSPDFDIPDLPPSEPLLEPEPLLVEMQFSPLPEGVEPSLSVPRNTTPPTPVVPSQPMAADPTPVPAAVPSTVPHVPANLPVQSTPTYSTQLQTQVARLLHVQTNTPVELPITLTVIHLGKPNDRIPPDVDVSGFPNSEIVSRIHADIRVEGDNYYIEDVGSSNGTYINNSPLPSGNRHRLRPGDRIALGKGDKVTFLFQIA